MKQRFLELFGVEASHKITVPSRVNLIGEHSDYFESFVLPMAISNVKMTALIRPRDDNRIKLHSNNLSGTDHPDVDFFITDDRSKDQWVQYVQGAIAMYAEEYTRRALKGFDLLIDSSIPIGGGLSSSSALTMTILAAMGIANGFTDGSENISSDEGLFIISGKGNDERSVRFLKKLCMMGCWAEYWYGTRGGAMDHFAVTVSKQEHATLLDNRSFEYQHIPLPSEVSFIVCNTMVRHNQLYSGFSERKKEAMRGFAKLQQWYPEAKNVRDITIEQLTAHQEDLLEGEYRRLRHPVTEKDRVKRFIEALGRGEYAVAGEIMNKAFVSLRDDYDVSCDELNIMQQAAVESPGCFGARITGGGFGGCIVALVDAAKKDDFMAAVKKKYDNNSAIKSQDISSEIWEAHSGDGLTISSI